MTSQLLRNQPYKPVSTTLSIYLQSDNYLSLLFRAQHSQETDRTIENTMSSSGLSNVGKGAFYEAGDQRNEPRSVINERERYEEGQHRSHNNIDSSKSPMQDSWPGVEWWANKNTTTEDDRSLGNKLAAQAKSDEPGEAGDRTYDPEAELSKRNPEAPVCVLHMSVFRGTVR